MAVAIPLKHTGAKLFESLIHELSLTHKTELCTNV